MSRYIESKKKPCVSGLVFFQMRIDSSIMPKIGILTLLLKYHKHECRKCVQKNLRFLAHSTTGAPYRSLNILWIYIKVHREQKKTMCFWTSFFFFQMRIDSSIMPKIGILTLLLKYHKHECRKCVQKNLRFLAHSTTGAPYRSLNILWIYVKVHREQKKNHVFLD